MAKELPSGFDPARITAGLKRAMEFGAPSKSQDRATFYLPSTPVHSGATDEDGVPFDPTASRATPMTAVTVPCAVDYDDRTDADANFGVYQPARIRITLLGPEYLRVKGFRYVVIAGDRYFYRLTEPPVALGTIDVWTVHAVNEDQA